MESAANALAQYVKTLSDFRLVDPEVPYYHMGATITDAMLQAGLNYKTVVKPRVNNLFTNYPEAKTTSGFLELTRRINLKVLLDWRGSEKPNRISEVIAFFIRERIETEQQLKEWFLNDENSVTKLSGVRGIGNKTADYFKILSGIPAIAVDRHLTKFLEQAGIPKGNYSDASEIISKAAEKMQINKSVLDHSIWKYMASKKKKNRCC